MGEMLAGRLGRVRVGIRPELEVSRHVFRSEPSYVIQDPVTFATHQLSVRDYRIFGALDDQLTLEQIFAGLVERGLLENGQEEPFYQFILRLHQLGLLSLPVSDVKSLHARFESKQRARRRSSLMSLLFVRVPMFDPDALLTRTVRFAAPLFWRGTFLLWMVAMLVSVAVVTMRWQEFRDPLGTMLALQNLPVLWVLLVGLKVIHEFGHAYACKHLGGQVPEMGAFFILLTPCAYMDASSSWSFTNRWHRIVVALAGVYFESFAAMLALLVWCLTGPSTLHSIAHYTVILSTVVTIGFNVNPLMRFDGYFVLSDLVNLPNLRQHAVTELQTFLKRALFGARVPSSFALRERLLLAAFGIASGAYKIVILIGISTIIASRVPVAGLLLAGGYLASVVVGMGTKLVQYLIWSEEIAAVRGRAVFVSGVCCAAVVAALCTVPIPNRVDAVGVVARRDDRVVRAPASGFLLESPVELGIGVAAGGRLCTLTNPDLVADVEKKSARVRLLRIALHEETDPIAAAAAAQRLRQAEEEQHEVQTQLAGLTVCVPASGEIVEMEALKRKGRFLQKGEALATVSRGEWIIDALADEESVSSSIPVPGDMVEVWLDSGWNRPVLGRVVSMDTTATRRIRHRALTHEVGGSIPVSSATSEAERPYFPVRVALVDPPIGDLRHGMRAQVRFSRRVMPAGQLLYRRLLHFVNRLHISNA